MEQLNAASVLPAGLNFLEHIHALSAWIQEVVMHGVHHGATAAQVASHLRSDVDLHAVEPWFPPELLVQRASYAFSYRSLDPSKFMFLLHSKGAISF